MKLLTLTSQFLGKIRFTACFAVITYTKFGIAENQIVRYDRNNANFKPNKQDIAW